MSEKIKAEQVARVIAILLFVGIYLAGLVMGLQELARKAASRASA